MKDTSKLQAACVRVLEQARLLEERGEAVAMAVDAVTDAVTLFISGHEYTPVAQYLATSNRPAVIVSTSCKCAGCEGEVCWCPERDAWRCLRCDPR